MRSELQIICKVIIFSN